MASSAWGQAVKETTLHFEKYAGLSALLPLTNEPTNWRGVKPLACLPDGHSLLAALTLLIRACGDQRFRNAGQVWEHVPPNLKRCKFEKSDVHIEVAFQLPFPEVNISVSALCPDPENIHAYVEPQIKLSYFMSIDERNSQILKLAPNLIDLHQIRYFGSSTLFSLGNLFRTEKADN
jgi:hypothetical protein